MNFLAVNPAPPLPPISLVPLIVDVYDLLAILPDELILLVLRELSPESLRSTSQCSSALLAFADAEELWEILAYD